MPSIFLAALAGFVAVILPVAVLRGVIALNRRSYALFCFDKRQAEQGGQRVPEAQLLAAAFWGGWIGAKLAQHRLRHKTRKEPFRSRLNRIGWMQGAAALAMTVIAVQGPQLAEGGVNLLVQFTRQVLVDGTGPAPADDGRRLPHRFGPGGDAG